MKATTCSIAYQGVSGAYSEKAIYKLLGNNVEAIGFQTFEQVFIAVQENKVNYGMIPIENSLGGSIHQNYDLLLRYESEIIAELDFHVEHCLLGNLNTKLNDIKYIISHPQALAQCENYIRSNLPHVICKTEYDTAGSAKIIQENKLMDTVAIASDLAGIKYNLNTLDRNIEDDKLNFTRFLLISRLIIKSNTIIKNNIEIKTSFVISLMNKSGELHKVLSVFSLRDISLTKIESRPLRKIVGKNETQNQNNNENQNENQHGDKSKDKSINIKYKYFFYIDIIGSMYDKNVINAINHLKEFCTFFRILGSYPTNGILQESIQIELMSQNNKNIILEKDTNVNKLKQLLIGIYGFGNFGQFLAKTFIKHNHIVYATSRTDYTKIAKKMNVLFIPFENQLDFFKNLDLHIIIFCTSIVSFENIIKNKIPLDELNNKLIIDVLSVKMFPKKILLQHLPESADILCTHPMFGPESGKDSWKDLIFMYEKVRFNGKNSKMNEKICDYFIKSTFIEEKCKIIEMTCEKHDFYAANSQLLTHFVGRLLLNFNIKSTSVDTRSFKFLLNLVADVSKDSYDLFYGLYKYNPYAIEQLNKLRSSFDHIYSNLIKTNDKDNELIKSNHINPLIETLEPSKTVIIHSLIKKIELENKNDVIDSLCVGEPDYSPPEEVKEAAINAINNDFVKYTSVNGLFELRKEISNYLKFKKQIDYDPNTEIIVGNGAKQMIYQILFVITKKYDKIIIPSPYWVSYPEMVKLQEGIPIIIKTTIENQYKLTPTLLEETLKLHHIDSNHTHKVKAIILCNPSNPTGVVYSKEDLLNLINVLNKPEYKDIFIISDEIYEQLLFETLPDNDTNKINDINYSLFSIASIENMKKRVFLINGFSKAFAMMGYRLGYLCGPEYYINGVNKLQSQLTSCANSISQKAGIAALKLSCTNSNYIIDKLNILKEKRKYIFTILDTIPFIKYIKSTGAFYIFVDISYYIQINNLNITNSTEFCEILLLKYKVALVPGCAFGDSNAIRIAYATNMETIQSGLNKLKLFLSTLLEK